MKQLQWELFPANLETSYFYTNDGHVKFMIVKVSDGYRLLIDKVVGGKILVTLIPDATTLEECKTHANEYVQRLLLERES